LSLKQKSRSLPLFLASQITPDVVLAVSHEALKKQCWAGPTDEGDKAVGVPVDVEHKVGVVDVVDTGHLRSQLGERIEVQIRDRRFPTFERVGGVGVIFHVLVQCQAGNDAGLQARPFLWRLSSHTNNIWHSAIAIKRKTKNTLLP
jgi:hypothetical protein